MRAWVIMGVMLTLAGCAMQPTTPGQPAPQPDYGSKAYGY